MITPNRIPAHLSPDVGPWPDDLWTKELAAAARDAETLLDAVQLERTDLPYPIDTAAQFQLLAPPSFIARMGRGNTNDPLLKQVLPTLQEQQVSAGFMRDPLAETDPDRGFIKAPSLLQKYQNRALLITTPGCAINCRYCFRREFPYTEHRPKNHQEALTAIAADQSISEIILSGGDPLLLSDSQLPQLLSNIESIPHVQRIRIHSRIPIVLPERLTQTLMDTLNNRRCQIVVVVHSNHPQELNATTARAFDCLKQGGVTLLNQSVLLRDINDDVATLVQLSEKLFTQGVLPYYLHLTDHVAGTEHFFIADDEAREIYAQMQRRLPGYLLPKLVRELPGEASKTLIA